MEVTNMGLRTRLVALLVGATALLGTVGAGTALAAQPWWHLSQSVRPHSISHRPVTKVSESQELTVSAPGTYGYVFVLSVAKKEVGVYNFSGLYPPSSAEEVQLTLEGKTSISEKYLSVLEEAGYGPGNVEVSLASGAPESAETLLVKSVGASAGKTVAPLEVAGYEGTAVKATVVKVGAAEGNFGRIVLQLTNVGDANVDGASTPVAIADALPSSLEAVTISGSAFGPYLEGAEPKTGERHDVSCSLETLECTFEDQLAPYGTIEVQIGVNVPEGAPASDEANVVEVSGGGAAAQKPFSQGVRVGNVPVPFGVESFHMAAEEEGGSADTLAGSHPFQLSTALAFNQAGEERPGEGSLQPAQPRNLKVRLPAGLVGNATVMPRCSMAKFTTLEKVRKGAIDKCPANTAVGVAAISYLYSPVAPHVLETNVAPVPLFNLASGPGEPARFGFVATKVPVVLDTHVRAGGDYGVSVTVENTPQSISFLSSLVTIWGVPGSPAHNAARGWSCLALESSCEAASLTEAPFLTMPSSCQSAMEAEMTANSWIEPAYLEPFASTLGSLDGCNQEPFAPAVDVEPEHTSAASATGATVRLHVPQQISEDPNAPAEADVRSTTVTLPAGLQLNPAAANGLQGCTEQQIGYLSSKGPNGELLFKGESEAERLGEVAHETGCPDQAKIGTVTVKTPLLKEDLTGAVYQAAQYANPFGSLLGLYVIAEAPQEGVRIRLAGKVEVKPGGQIVSTFPNTPQVPFEDFELKFFGEGQAPLATTGCGTYKTTSAITSWAGGTVTPFSQFTVPASSCNGLGGFKPSFAAGTTNNHAGSFSPLVTTIARKDGEQSLGAIAMTMPKGLAGMVANVPQCPAAVANAQAWNCPAASKVGHVIVHAGVGNEPVQLPEAGKPEDPAYLTGPYDGAPFGLAFVVPAEAGPFNLDEGGHPVVVRAKIEINPVTAQVSIVAGQMPTELHNINLDVRSVEVVVDHPNFMFNPTDCEEQQLTGTLGSAEGGKEAVSTRFQAASCAALPFKPKFSVLVHAHHTRKNGAYFHAVMKSSAGQANIHKVDVQLPRALAVRDSTLKEACPEAQYAANPAGCPANSFVGHARVKTPILAKPLTGPAIFVSHAGKEFPNLDLVLQGEGVTIQLTSNTYVGKKGLTFSRFETVPDAPFSRFDLVLPAGKYSALAGNGNFCKHRLQMPTKITGQNGARIEEKTKLKVTGCGPRFFVRKVHVHGDKATIVVHAPYAGKLTANGKGISKATKRIKNHGGRLAVTVKLKRHFVKQLHHSRRHHIKVNVHLHFRSHHHKTLKGHVKVKLR